MLQDGKKWTFSVLAVCGCQRQLLTLKTNMMSIFGLETHFEPLGGKFEILKFWSIYIVKFLDRVYFNKKLPINLDFDQKWKTSKISISQVPSLCAKIIFSTPD